MVYILQLWGGDLFYSRYDVLYETDTGTKSSDLGLSGD